MGGLKNLLTTTNSLMLPDLNNSRKLMMSIHFVNANGCQCEKCDFPPNKLSANLAPTVDSKVFMWAKCLSTFLTCDCTVELTNEIGMCLTGLGELKNNNNDKVCDVLVTAVKCIISALVRTCISIADGLSAFGEKMFCPP